MTELLKDDAGRLRRVWVCSCSEPECAEVALIKAPSRGHANNALVRRGWDTTTTGRWWCPSHQRAARDRQHRELMKQAPTEARR